MLNITFECIPVGNTGYGKHSREVALALNKICNLKLLGVYTPDLPRELKPCFERENAYEVLLSLRPPYYWSSEIHNYKKVVGYGIFEGDKVPCGWAIHANKVSSIIVPSTHTKQAFLNGWASMSDHAGALKPEVHVVPHGVNKEVYKPEGEVSEKLMNQFRDHYKFLFVGGWSQGMNDRKGAQFLLKAFCEEFNENDKVLLLMKYNTHYSTPEQIEAQIRELKLENKHVTILQVFDNLSEEELAKLYRSCDCLVSPHMSEAWGMQMSEALACGTPVLSTAYGGNMDYTLEGRIHGKMVQAISNPAHFYEETQWMKPDINDIRKKMRDYYERRVRKSANNDMLISWDETAKRIIKVIKE